MRLEQLQYFIQIVEHRSFNKAAKKLFITQPALTTSIKQLENELGIQLLVRSNKGVYPTSYGIKIYDDCKYIINALNNKICNWKTWSSHEKKHKETVSLLGIPFSCSYLMDEVIPSLKNQMEYVDFILHEAFHDNVYDFLKHGMTHIALTFIVDKYEESMKKMYKSIQFDMEDLVEDEFAVFLSTHNTLAAKPVLTVEDCRALKFATYSVEYDRRGIIFNNIRKTLDIRNYEYLNSRESVMQKIVENQCAGLFLKKMSKNNSQIRNGHICAKLVAGKRLLPSRHYLLWRDSVLTEAERATLAFIRRHYAAFYAQEA